MERNHLGLVNKHLFNTLHTDTLASTEAKTFEETEIPSTDKNHNKQVRPPVFQHYFNEIPNC